MRERANLHGGSVTAGPVAGRGWLVAATLRPDMTTVKT
jgi:signal transduction histidine kinase